MVEESAPPPRQAGAFVIHERIAGGSFGEVFRASHAETGAPAAVKIMRAELAASEEARARFAQEVEATARLAHPSVLSVLEAGRIEHGRLYVATELLVGESLEAELARCGRLERDRAFTVIEALAGALSAAHGAGIVHRDVKASNVFVCESGRIVLLDFGVAKLLDGASVMTSTGDIIGSLSCMAPEQILNRPIDARTDVYALGVLAYRMLAGASPFAAKHPIAVQQMHIYATPRAPSSIAPTDPALDAPILAALAKSPDARPASVEAFVASLRSAI